MLGSFQVILDGEPVTDFTTDKAQALLAYLSVESDRPHRRETLSDLLWPNRPSQKARQSLRQALSHLRQAVGDRDAAEPPETEGERRPSGPLSEGMDPPGAKHSAPFLLVSRQTVQINPWSDYWTDVAAFTSLVEACRRHRHRQRQTCLPCLARMERMVELYRGEFLEHSVTHTGPMFEEWAIMEREWLHREVMDALVHLANHHERRGEMDRARRYARRQVAMEPWREEAHRQLMRLLAIDGERSAALAQYGACRRALMQELGVEPTAQTKALYETIRASDEPPSSLLPAAPPCRLPPVPTPFVGRDEELADLAELLASPECRLVTLAGPGGVGKTRLAVQAATDQIGNFSGGITFAPLPAVGRPELLAPTIAAAAGLSLHEGMDTERQLLHYLRGKEILLVLDGMEHMLAGGRLLSQILRQAPDVMLLVTSRERLNLQEEWVRSVEGLAYPREGESEGHGPRETASAFGEDLPGEVLGYSAIELFNQQARRADHAFSLSSADVPSAVRICQLVEGLPLGLELAASWTHVQSCPEIAQAIEHNLDTLTTRLRDVPERQRSLRATFDYSWQLLSKEERDALPRLSVFAGGFSRDAALGVTGASGETLLALADKSLMRRVAEDRFDMHSLVRHYAAEKLALNAPAQVDAEMQHASYFASLLERERSSLEEALGSAPFQRLNPQIENVRRAWESAVKHDCPSLIEQSLDTLYLLYDVQCRFEEGIDLFAGAVARWTGDSEREPILCRVISRQGALCLRLGLYVRARDTLAQGLEMAQRLHMEAEAVFCLVHLSRALYNEGKYAASARLCTRSLALARRIGDAWGEAQSLLSLGSIHYRTGDVDGAERLLEESLSVARERDNPRMVIAPLNVLGDVACHRGNYRRGLALFEECRGLSRDLGHDFQLAVILNNLGTVLQVLKRHGEARSAYQESLEICTRIGDPGGEAIALSNLGELAYEDGACTEAERLYRQGLAIGREIEDQWTVMACLNNLGEVAFARQDYDGAGECLTEALTVAWETRTLPMVLKILVNTAALVAQEGNSNCAAELLEAVHGHPASEEATRERARRLLGDMGLSARDSADRPLDMLVNDLLTRPRPRSIPPSQ